MGFSRIEQAEENLKAIPLLEKWNKELEARLNEHIKTDPEMPMDMNTWGP